MSSNQRYHVSFIHETAVGPVDFDEFTVFAETEDDAIEKASNQWDGDLDDSVEVEVQQ